MPSQAKPKPKNTPPTIPPFGAGPGLRTQVKSPTPKKARSYYAPSSATPPLPKPAAPVSRPATRARVASVATPISIRKNVPAASGAPKGAGSAERKKPDAAARTSDRKVSGSIAVKAPVSQRSKSSLGKPITPQSVPKPVLRGSASPKKKDVASSTAVGEQAPVIEGPDLTLKCEEVVAGLPEAGGGSDEVMGPANEAARSVGAEASDEQPVTKTDDVDVEKIGADDQLVNQLQSLDVGPTPSTEPVDESVEPVDTSVEPVDESVKPVDESVKPDDAEPSVAQPDEVAPASATPSVPVSFPRIEPPTEQDEPQALSPSDVNAILSRDHECEASGEGEAADQPDTLDSASSDQIHIATSSTGSTNESMAVLNPTIIVEPKKAHTKRRSGVAAW